jgi:adenylosuccinate synthase
MEGAQGTLLDLDHGTYPYVTSSSASVGGAAAGLGIHPRSISGVIGVFKAYCTRVGSGPFPTEMLDERADELRERAWEYGTTTGRARRIGWFDAVAARYSQHINGFSSLVLTRLDVLDGFPSVKICVGYELDGELLGYFPSGATQLERCKPVYEEMPGWSDPTEGATRMEQLPAEAAAYVGRLEELIGCEFHLISTGPHRDETIMLKPMI